MNNLQKSNLGVENSLLVYTILSVAGQLKSTLEDVLEESGLNYNSYNILLALANSPGNKADINELADMSGLDIGRSARLAKLLVVLQYAQVSDTSPVLKFVLNLTDKGKQTIQQLKSLDMLMDYSFESINEAEKVEMLSLLGKIHAPWVLKAVG